MPRRVVGLCPFRTGKAGFTPGTGGLVFPFHWRSLGSALIVCSCGSCRELPEPAQQKSLNSKEPGRET